MANECIPIFEPGDQLTATAVGAVTGKTFVNLSGATFDPATGTLPSVATAAAAGLVVGVAAYDVAAGGRVRVLGEGILPVTAGGNVAAGAEVEVGANGRAVTLAAGKAVGRAFTAGTNGNDCFVRLYR